MVWNIYGKKYDLALFIKNHPGGKDILVNTENEPDITVLFETYHAFSNIDQMKKHLKKYEIVESINESDTDTDITNKPPQKQYDFENYHKLTLEIQTKLGFYNRMSIKADIGWILQNVFVTLAYIACFYQAMFSTYSTWIRCLFSILSGICYVSMGFSAMHDASHYGVSIYPKINIEINKWWNGWGLWNADIWFYHHVLNHHSFTGEEKKDPDLYHLKPFYNKIHHIKKQLFHRFPELIIPVLTIFPGQYVGQAIAYATSYIKHRIFQVQLPKRDMYDTFNKCLVVLKLFSLYFGGFPSTICYFLTINTVYHINIIFDHDTYETAVDNHYEGDDWLKLQVCNSANFLNDNMFWTRAFGGINYQIEHHLFPNMSNIHYPTIAPIVKKFCEEHNIPYVNHPTIFGAYKSYLKTIRHYNS